MTGVVSDTPAALLRPSSSVDAVAKLHAITEIAKRTAGVVGFHEVVELAAGAALEALSAASLSLSVWERDQARVRVLINIGEMAACEARFPDDETYLLTDYPETLSIFDGGTGYALSRRAGPLPGQESVHALLDLLGKDCCLGVPILLEGRIWGELFATRSPQQPEFTQADVDFAAVVSAQVAAAISQAQHLERVARLAYTDALTGLANRRAIDDRLDAAMDRHECDGTVIGLVVVDVNGLKRINDGRGHEAGDRALVHFAGLLSISAGLVAGSLAGRTGGDEFCIIMEGASADDAVRVAEDLCRRASASLDEGIACGVASTDDPVGSVDTPARLFRLADAAQTRAKRSRYLRPVVAGRGMPEPAAANTGDATVAMADAAEADRRPSKERGDRRRVRRARSHSAHRLIEDVLETLDHSAAITVQDRLEIVTVTLARLVDVCSWWLSYTSDDGALLHTAGFSALRLAGGHVLDPDAPGLGTGTYLVADYPITQAVLLGGKATIFADDLGADPGERAILDAAGYTAVVMAGGADATGRRWLIEMFIDELSGDAATLPTALRALTACALLTPRP